MTYSPAIGHHVIVADKASIYNGQEAVVSAVRTVGGVVVYTVEVGSISFPLIRANLREVKYGEC